MGVMELQQAREQQGIRVLQVAQVPQEFQEKLPILGQREIRERRDLQEIKALLVISALLVILVPQGLRVQTVSRETRGRRGRLVRQDQLV